MNSLFVVDIRFAPPYLREHRKLSHHPQYGLQIDIFAGLPLNPAAYKAAAVGLFTALLTFYNQVDQPLIFAFLPLSAAPCVVPAAGNLEHTAHSVYMILAAEPFDDAILQLHLLPASHRKFRSSSTCIRSSMSSLLRLVSSSAACFLGRPFARGT